jgi:hypothetical protein
MSKRGDIREYRTEKRVQLAIIWISRSQKYLRMICHASRRAKGQSAETLWTDLVSLRPLRMPAATSKRAAVASAVQSFKSASRSASHAQGRLAESSAVVLSASIGTPGFNGSQECNLKNADAITAVGSIIKEEYSPFELVDAVEFHRLGKTSLKMPYWLKRFESQWDYISCTGHRAQNTGYVVSSICCSSMKNDFWRDGVLNLGTTGGNNSLIRHAKGHFHVGRNANSIPTTRMTNALKKAEVPAIVLDF